MRRPLHVRPWSTELLDVICDALPDRPSPRTSGALIPVMTRHPIRDLRPPPCPPSVAERVNIDGTKRTRVEELAASRKRCRYHEDWTTKPKTASLIGENDGAIGTRGRDADRLTVRKCTTSSTPPRRTPPEGKDPHPPL